MQDYIPSQPPADAVLVQEIVVPQTDMDAFQNASAFIAALELAGKDGGCYGVDSRHRHADGASLLSRIIDKLQATNHTHAVAEAMRRNIL